jgi:glycosyltransferase involved in cell wall biosynthesis
MHIAFNGWFWDQPNAGSGQYLRRLLHNLRRIAPDLQMTLILPPHITAPDDVPENVSLVTTTGLRGKIGKIWFEQRTFPQKVGQVGADIAHIPYWGSPLDSPAKVVTSVLDVIPLAIPDYARPIGTRFYTSLVSASARGSSHVITLSSAAKADIVKYLNIPEERITPIYLAADDSFHPRVGKERDEAVRAKYHLPERFVLYLGGFDVRKQVNQLLLAYTFVIEAEGDELPLVLGGKEPLWGTTVFPDLRKYTADLNLTEDVRWIGFVDEEDKPSLYRLAEVFVYPSIYEGFGLGVIEAMACGTPVVASEIPVMEEIVGNGAFLVSNAREMAGAIIALTLQKPLRETMINQGLGQATKFSWRKTAKETLAVYEKVMREK